MPSLNFKPRFVDPIMKKTKRSTIRKTKREYAAGDRLFLNTGSRYKPFRLGEATVVSTSRIWIKFTQRVIEFPDRTLIRHEDVQRFAEQEGFKDLEDMHAFFAAVHGGKVLHRGFIFSGTYVFWDHTFTPAPPLPAADVELISESKAGRMAVPK